MAITGLWWLPVTPYTSGKCCLYDTADGLLCRSFAVVTEIWLGGALVSFVWVMDGVVPAGWRLWGKPWRSRFAEGVAGLARCSQVA